MSDRTDYSTDDLALLDRLQAITPDDHRLVAPPAGLWAAIEREVSADAATVLETSDDASTTSGGPTAERVGRRPLRSGRWRIVLTAAAAVVALVGGFLALSGRADGPEQRTIASAQLSSDGLDSAPPGHTGKATVIETGSTDIIKVDVGDLAPTSGEYLEVWLIKADLSGLVSLGTVRDDGEYELPAGLSLADYPIVDISTEPHDGDPGHSGLSLLRGQLA